MNDMLTAKEANIMTRAYRIASFERGRKHYHYSIESQIVEAAEQGQTSIEVGMPSEDGKKWWTDMGYTVSENEGNMVISWANPVSIEEDYDCH